MGDKHTPSGELIEALHGHRNELVRWIWHRWPMLRVAAVEEVVQDAFLGVLEGEIPLPDHRDPARLRKFMFVVAEGFARNRVRREDVRSGVPLHDHLGDLNGGRDVGWRHARNIELRTQFERAYAALSPELREILDLYVLKGLSYCTQLMT